MVLVLVLSGVIETCGKENLVIFSGIFSCLGVCSTADSTCLVSVNLVSGELGLVGSALVCLVSLVSCFSLSSVVLLFTNSFMTSLLDSLLFGFISKLVTLPITLVNISVAVGNVKDFNSRRFMIILSASSLRGSMVFSLFFL